MRPVTTSPPSDAAHLAIAMTRSSPSPISFSGSQSRPIGIRTSAASPAGMTMTLMTGMARRLADRPQTADAMKMLDREKRRRQSADQGCNENTGREFPKDEKRFEKCINGGSAPLSSRRRQIE